MSDLASPLCSLSVQLAGRSSANLAVDDGFESTSRVMRHYCLNSVLGVSSKDYRAHRLGPQILFR